MEGYLSFEYQRTSTSGRTKNWEVLGHGDVRLGQVKWYGAWRRYVFYPEVETLFDARCLAEIQKFLDARMNERKEAKQ